MPVFNAEAYLKEAIESILKQTYRNFEFIIVNDNSTDGSWKIIRSYKNKHRKLITAINLEKTLNHGGDACANAALEVARGKYIARMDADDIAHPKRLEKQVAYLEDHKYTYLVGSNAHVINKNGKVIGKKLEPLTHEDIYNAYFTFHPIIHPTAMYRRFLNSKIPFMYPKKYTANNDYFGFFTLICKGYRFANLEDKLLYYRIHDKNDTFNNIREKFLNTLNIRITMVLKHGYSPNSKQVAITAIQTFASLLLPNAVIRYIYFVSKGIIKIKIPKLRIGQLIKFKRSFRTAGHI